MHRLRGFMRNLNIVEISQAQSLITVLSSRCFWRCWIATLILEGRWLMEMANIFRCSRENKTATACQRITQGNSEQNQSQFNFMDAPCVGGPRGCRTKTWFQPRPRERSIDRDRTLAGLHGCIRSERACRYIMFVEDRVLASKHVTFPLESN